jgi:hypothetical protein
MSDVISRFDYQANRRAAGTYAGHRSPFWPPLDRYVIAALDLSRDEPNLEHGFDQRIGALRDAIEEEWLRGPIEEGGTEFADPQAVASILRSLVEFLPSEDDRQALTLRADAVEDGPRGPQCPLGGCHRRRRANFHLAWEAPAPDAHRFRLPSRPSAPASR